ncbi:hypothetical protein QTV43_000027 [Vibrio vulnificus]|nr:hypothetical protein [Vibrio vulnificus]
MHVSDTLQRKIDKAHLKMLAVFGVDIIQTHMAIELFNASIKSLGKTVTEKNEHISGILVHGLTCIMQAPPELYTEDVQAFCTKLVVQTKKICTPNMEERLNNLLDHLDKQQKQMSSLEARDQQIDRDIKEFGLSIAVVGCGVDIPFFYTCGCSIKELPEIFLSGDLPKPVMGTLLNLIPQYLEQNREEILGSNPYNSPQEIELGAFLEDIMGVDQPFKLVALDVNSYEFKEVYCYQSIAAAERHNVTVKSAYQVYWVDKQGVMCDQPDFGLKDMVELLPTRLRPC